MAPPLQLHDATMSAFLVGADLGALTAMIDAQLNAVSAAAGVVYKPLLPMVAVICADVVTSYSTTPPDDAKGWNGERDFGIWVPIVAGTIAPDGSWRAGRIGWYLPYVFVDNVAAMVTGREVYGFFKQLAVLTCPATPTAPGMFAIDALVIPRYAPSAQAENLRLLTITDTDPGAPAGGPPGGAPWADARSAAVAVWATLKRAFFDGAVGLPVPAWDLVVNLLEDLVTGDVPLVFLKQFRGAGVEATACYQAVVEAPAKLERWKGGWFTTPKTIAITPVDSHPIVRECGLAGATITGAFGFWCQMDFVMQPGKVIASR
jgi:hypothetical protein